MTTTLPDLWPETLRVEVLSPLVVLRAQADALGRITRGVVRADITSVDNPGRVTHRFDLVAPALGGVRQRLLSATHNLDVLYPVELEAPSFRHQSDDGDSFSRWAGTYQQFIDLLREALQSGATTAMIQSLIARSNERYGGPDGEGPDDVDEPAA